MTDEQWVWLFVNQLIDDDEYKEKLCPKCKDEVASENKCIRCGKPLDITDGFVNPNFDRSRFDKLSCGIDPNDCDGDHNDHDDDDDSIDPDLSKQIMEKFGINTESD